MPQQLAGRRVKCRDDPADAEREQLALIVERRRFWAGALRRGDREYSGSEARAYGNSGELTCDPVETMM